jgi:serine/threonine protein kinase/predicted ATPase
MDSQRHERLSELFLRARELPPEDRPAFLDEACTGDAALRADVESLLDHDRGALQVLEEGVQAAYTEAMSSGRRGDPAPSASETPRIAGYEILSLIGEGGMGQVYLAEDTALRRRVAVKIVSPVLIGSEQAANRFQREARVMATVEHPHIVRVYSLGQTDGRHYLVMEYVEGRSLAERIRQDGRLDVDDALHVLRQATEALEAAWGRGIVHRDVKPANILIDSRGQVRVVDFGLAKATMLHGDSSISDGAHVLGTPRYVSPEQARGDQDLDFHSDIYSLGVVLYEMLAGEPPYTGATAITVVDQHLHMPLPSLRSRCPEIAGEVEQLCAWMTRKQPADRPSSYALLLQHIDALLGEAPPPRVTQQALPGFLPASDRRAGTDVSGPIFVAREQELASLNRFLDEAVAGCGRVAFVTGEAGSGKTALIDEFARRAQSARADLIVARGNCNAQTGMGDPYLPFREVLGLLTGAVEARRAPSVFGSEHAERLWNLLPLAAQALIDDGPDLVGTFVPGATLVARAEAHTPSPTGWRVRLEELATRSAANPADVTRQQSYLFEQYTRTLLTLARDHPLLLQLEDLHWADVGSSSLLFHLGRRLAHSRILVLGTFRPAEMALGRDDQRHPLETVVNELKAQLGDVEVSLGDEESREFVDALVDARPNKLRELFRDAVFRQTRGHPLFTVELLRSMQERGMLVQDPDGLWVERPTLDWKTLPARVEGVIAERIARLPEDARRVLGIACVQGEEFTAEVLARIHRTDEREMIRLLSDDLDKRHHLVSALGIRRTVGRRSSLYRFRHILFQKYLYGRMDRVERAIRHEEVGATLEELHGERAGEIAVDLARHFQEAGLTDKAIDYLRQAGDEARRLSANEEAIAHYNKALTLLETLPESPERVRQELALQLGLGAPLMVKVGPGSPELGHAYARARELCQEVGDAQQLLQMLFVLVIYHSSLGNLRTCLELAEQMLSVVEEASDVPFGILAHWARAFSFLFHGRFAEANGDLDRVMELYDPVHHNAMAYLCAYEPGISGLTFKSSVLWFLGHPDQALKCNENALDLARKLDHPHSLAHTLTLAGFLAMYRRDHELLEQHVEAVLRVATEKGAAHFEAWGILLRGRLRALRGRTEEGIAGMLEGLAAVKATGSELGHPQVLGMLAEAYAQAGKTEEGLALIDEALATSQTHDEHYFEAELYRLKGELTLKKGAAGAVTEAEASFRRALDVARRQSAKSWELRSAMSLGRVWRTRGRLAEARTLLADVLGWFTEGFDTPDLVEARALLDELS